MRGLSHPNSSAGRRTRAVPLLVLLTAFLGTLLAVPVEGASRPALAARLLSANGTWTKVLTPAVPEGQASLLGVGCQSASLCFAVGVDHTSPIVEQYQGGAWAGGDVPPASPAGLSGTELSSVACASSSLCWAVGGLGETETLLDEYQAGAWSTVPDAAQTTAGVYSPVLYGVACPTSTSCLMVGATQKGALIENWGGGAFSLTQTAGTERGWLGILQSVSCPSSSSCWAVGATIPNLENQKQEVRTFTEHWNGSTWQVVQSPDPGKNQSQLLSVSCQTESSCYAVGSTEVRKFDTAPLILHLVGGRWKVLQDSLPKKDGEGDLTGVSCATGLGCLAVGADQQLSRPLAESLAGAAYRVLGGVPGKEQLAAISCPTSSGCWVSGPTASDSAPPIILEYHP
ncbi:MAG: hypothetical protein WBA31_00985 [Candidatus Dormiibacterota bacterium]